MTHPAENDLWRTCDVCEHTAHASACTHQVRTLRDTYRDCGCTRVIPPVATDDEVRP